MNNQISLRIHSVKCVDETGGGFAERFGNDEIYLAGFGINSNAEPVMVNVFQIYPHFDDGDIKRFSPPRNFITLDLTEGGVFPKTRLVGFLLAEKDQGGFGSGATAVFNMLVDEINRKKLEAAETMRSSGAATADGLKEDALKKIVDMVISDLYGWVKNKIISGAKDDIFPLRVATATIGSADFTWNGSRTSPPAAIDFRGHDGVYLMTYDWVLS